MNNPLVKVIRMEDEIDAEEYFRKKDKKKDRKRQKSFHMSDEEYKAQKPTLSNQDHILFIGRSNVLSEEEYGIKKVFDRFQMQYGWLGRRAYLKVTGERLKKDQIQPYIEFAKKYDPDVTFESIFGLEAQAERRSRNGLQRFLETGKKYGFVGPGPIAVLENKKKKSFNPNFDSNNRNKRGKK